MIREHRFPDRDAAAVELAEQAAEILRAAVEDRGSASIAVSGGSTPARFFRRLSETPLPWDRITVTLVDERWVDPAEPASNERLVREELLRGPASAARFVGMKTAAVGPAEGRLEVEPLLAALRPIDLVVLGMGTDGHTASLFPGAEGLSAALDPEFEMTTAAIDPPNADHARMTLTLRSILEAGKIVLLLAGEAKWEVYGRALEPGPSEEMPVRGVLRAVEAETDVYWSP